MRQENRTTGQVGSAHTEVQPTRIWISTRTTTVLLVGGLVALVLPFLARARQTLRVSSILIFLAVIAGGEIAGLLGVVSAVPAVLRVLYDFFRARLRIKR